MAAPILDDNSTSQAIRRHATGCTASASRDRHALEPGDLNRASAVAKQRTVAAATAHALN